jgi:predicted dehydrogenase
MDEYLKWLDKTIGEPIAGGRIGRPVFVRAHAELISDHGLLIALLGHFVRMSASWMNSPLRRLYAQGGARAGYLSALLEFSAGQTALAGATLRRGEQGEVSFLIAGQQGTLRLDDLPEPWQLDGQLPAGDARIMQALERSLSSSAPVSLPER